MKAKPQKLVKGEGYVDCSIEDATHITLNIPTYKFPLTLPVIQKGTRDGSGCWSWNGDIDFPTIRPSVLTTNNEFRSHSWINDGQAQFLADCSHSLAGQTVDLLEL